MSVKIRIAKIWDRTREEYAQRVKDQDFQARQLLADRLAEDEFAARVNRNVAAREARKTVRFLNKSVPSFLRRQAS